MNEEQRRKQEVEATAQLEPIQTLPRGLDQIFREYYQTVFRAAYRITGNSSDAEDVLQSVFLRLLGRDPGAEAVGNMEAFLRRAAVNGALDLIRSRQATRNIPLEEVAPLLPENSSRAPDRVQRSAEIRQWLRGAVSRLSPRAAEIFVLR